MSYYMNNISFHGGGETTGSIAQNANSTSTCPRCRQMSFKADSFEYTNKPQEKKHTGLKIILGTLATAGLVIGGLGCASKYANKLPEWIFPEIQNIEQAQAYLREYNRMNGIKKGKVPTNEETIKMRLYNIYMSQKKRK